MSEMEDKMEKSCGACALKDRCLQTTEDCFTRRQRWKALWLGYMLPFLILAGGIVVMSVLKWDEMWIGGIALAFVVVYYFILWLCKPTI